MFPLRLIATLLLCTSPLVAAGQPESGQASPEGTGGESPAPDTVPGEAETSAPVALEGDVIILTTGSKLTGIQVLRRTPKSVEVEVVPGEEPMSISMKLVADILYDDIDPVKLRREQAQAKLNPQPNVLEGQELSPELLKKLNTPVSEEEMPFESTNFVEVIRNLATKVEIDLQVSDEVRKLPPEVRAWSGTFPANATFQDILTQQLLVSFPDIRVNYTLDQVELALKKPATPPAPAPANP